MVRRESYAGRRYRERRNFQAMPALPPHRSVTNHIADWISSADPRYGSGRVVQTQPSAPQEVRHDAPIDSEVALGATYRTRLSTKRSPTADGRRKLSASRREPPPFRRLALVTLRFFANSESLNRNSLYAMLRWDQITTRPLRRQAQTQHRRRGTCRLCRAASPPAIHLCPSARSVVHNWDFMGGLRTIVPIALNMERDQHGYPTQHVPTRRNTADFPAKGEPL